MLKLKRAFILLVLTVAGLVGASARASLADGPNQCADLLAKSDDRPERTVADSSTALTQALKDFPILGNQPEAWRLRIQTPDRGVFYALNFNKLLKQNIDGGKETALAHMFLHDFIPHLYRAHLPLPESVIERIAESGEDADFLKHLVLILNVDETDGATRIRGGMGLYITDNGLEPLPLEKDMSEDLPDFDLQKLISSGAHKAEVTRTGIDPRIQDPQLFGILIDLMTAIAPQDPSIKNVLIHTSVVHARLYARKVSNFVILEKFVNGDIPEVVAEVYNRPTETQAAH